MVLSMVGPTPAVEKMLRESPQLLPHARTEHLTLVAIDPQGDDVRAEWRLLLNYRSAP
jgi:hypothetical protein